MNRQQHRARSGLRRPAPGRDGATRPAGAPGGPGPGTPASGTPLPGTPLPGTPPAPGHQPPGDSDPAAQAALTVDALGKKCPMPIIMLADRIREVPVGQTIEVLADDPAARTDLPAWCALKSQEFVRAQALTVGWSFLVRRSY